MVGEEKIKWEGEREKKRGGEHHGYRTRRDGGSVGLDLHFALHPFAIGIAFGI